MAAIDDLLQKVSDPVLRERLTKEIQKLKNKKGFGLVFEEHMPECTPLYEIPVTKGSRVAPRDKEIKETFTVASVDGDTAHCISNTDKSGHDFCVKDIVVTAEIGEAIYPYLKEIDRVCNAPENDTWHTLIEADNYHALQLLKYMYAGKVDCIYIDPPYNTGAKDWKYNNRFVDSSDAYPHSKWLSFMKRRLELAKELLNPEDSVLIVTIDEKEYLRLGMLLEDMFKEARIQMVSSLINPRGQARDGQFARADEYIYIVEIGEMGANKLVLSDEWRIGKSTHMNNILWQYLRRLGTTDKATRKSSPGCFYPIFVYPETLKVHSIGDAIPLSEKKENVIAPAGTVAIWPMRSNDNEEGCWQTVPDKLRILLQDGFVQINSCSFNGIMYLKNGEREKIKKGFYKVIGHRANDNSVIVEKTGDAPFIPSTQWRISTHDAGSGGKKLLNRILDGNRFTFPKSLYAVHDVLKFYVANKSDAIILDFFAGSGTTLHAVNLLNAEDGGHRRCISVTNNEVSAEETKYMTAAGLRPGDDKWEQYGIARYVTWPRTKCSILGVDVNGNPLSGDYGCNIDSYEEIEADVTDSDTGKKMRGKVYKKVKKPSYPELDGMKMEDGFKANAVYFKLGFLDRNAVALGRQFRELLPVLWMKAGCIGPCPQVRDDDIPDMMVLPQNKMAVLIDETSFASFAKEMENHPEIETVYIITDSERGYREMIHTLGVKNTYRLYRDYLENFRINLKG